MLGWIIPMFIVELYLWAIDPPWLRAAWEFISSTIAACLEGIQTGTIRVVRWLLRRIPRRYARM